MNKNKDTMIIDIDRMTIKFDGSEYLLIPLPILEEFKKMTREQVGRAVLYAMLYAASPTERPTRDEHRKKH